MLRYYDKQSKQISPNNVYTQEKLHEKEERKIDVAQTFHLVNFSFELHIQR